MNDGDIADSIRAAVQLVAQQSGVASSQGSSNSDDVKRKSESKLSADCVVVVCGTAFIMADARAAVGVEEERDGDDLFFSPQSSPTASAAKTL